MPEGDTVWLVSRRLHAALAGRQLTRFELRVPRYATADLAGRTVLEVLPRGKHLLTRFEPDLTLHTHLRMDGAWHLVPAGSRWRGGPAHQVRVLLANAEWQAVGYRLHDVELLPTAQEHQLVGHLGPDLLGPDWDLDEAVRRLASAPEREIGEALLDQRNLAGVGNLYRTETLFLCGLSPFAPVGELPDPAAVVSTARRLMLANRDRPQQSTTGSLRRGELHWVFERAGRPCRRCGEAVAVAEQQVGRSTRVTYWCRRCQPAPGTQRAEISAVRPRRLEDQRPGQRGRRWPPPTAG